MRQEIEFNVLKIERKRNTMNINLKEHLNIYFSLIDSIIDVYFSLIDSIIDV
jgi:hypothetical protein